MVERRREMKEVKDVKEGRRKRNREDGRMEGKRKSASKLPFKKLHFYIYDNIFNGT